MIRKGTLGELERVPERGHAEQRENERKTDRERGKDEELEKEGKGESYREKERGIWKTREKE